MAKAAAVSDEEVETPEVKKGKSKLLIIAVAVLLLLIAGAGAYLFLLSSTDDTAEFEEEVEEVVVEPVTPPEFYVLEPFVVNLAKPDENRYLQIGITYELSNVTAVDEVKSYTPIIRSRILMVLSGKTIDNLGSIQGKQQLMDELVELARLTIIGDEIDPTKGVRDVHFSSFVIQ